MYINMHISINIYMQQEIHTHVIIHVDACVIPHIHCLIHAAALTQCTADSAVAGASVAHRVLSAACYYA